MLYRVKRALHEAWYNAWCRRVYRTPPISSDPKAPYVVTLLHSAAIIPYLIALKSFFHFCTPADVVILDDGSLSEKDLSLLARHIRGVRILNISDYADCRIPCGGCWERLALVSRLVQDKFTIQLDSDTLSLDYLRSVQSCICNEQPFFLPGHPGAVFGSSERIAQEWQRLNPTNIQSKAESTLINHATRWPLYAKGCAAFAGYPKQSFNFETVATISETFGGELGENWSDWGSEQFAANLIVANLDKAMMLPEAQYLSYSPSLGRGNLSMAFLHFYGTHRFAKGCYLAQSRRVLAVLQNT